MYFNSQTRFGNVTGSGANRLIEILPSEPSPMGVGGLDLQMLASFLGQGKELMLQAVKQNPELREKLRIALPAIGQLLGEWIGHASVVALERALKKLP